MLLILAVLVIALAAGSMLRVKRPDDRFAPPHLGWMSERWLAEHRASHPRG